MLKMKNKNERTDLPERPHVHFLSVQTRNLYIVQIAFITVAIICISLIAALVLIVRTPKPVVLFDMSSGRNYGAKTTKYNVSILESNLVYYSRQFCECLFNATSGEIEGSRHTALDLMDPSLQQKLKLTENNFIMTDYVKQVKDNGIVSTIEWNAPPQITVRNDPEYTMICQFTVNIKTGNQLEKVKHNVVVRWKRYGSYDPMLRACPVFVSYFHDGDLNDFEIVKQLEILSSKQQ